MAGPLDDYRAKFPQYKDVPDERLAEGMFNKYYAGKMTREQFNEKVGLKVHAQGSKFDPAHPVFSDDPDYQPPLEAPSKTDRGTFLPLTVTNEGGVDKRGVGWPGLIQEPMHDFMIARKALEQGALPSETTEKMLPTAQLAVTGTRFPGQATTRLPSRQPAETAAARASRMVREEATTGTGSTTAADLEATTGQQISDAATHGQDLRLADVGGENTRGLMRWAANVSPAARQRFEEFLNPRFRSQTERMSNWLRRATNNPEEAFVAIEGIKEKARSPNTQAYIDAFNEGKNGVSNEQGNDGLMRMFGSAWGKDVLADATSRWEMKRMAGNTQGFSDYVQAGKNRGRFTLAFWDQVKRVLDSQSTTYKKANDIERKLDVDGFKRALIDRLDKVFPLYAKARGQAAAAFNATDAIEAGENLMDGNWTRAQIEAVHKQVGPEEWGRVQLGFISEYLFRLEGTADRSNIVDRLINNPLDRARMDAVMGPNVREMLSAVLTTEQLQQRTLAALGNSTTARQLAEMIRHNMPSEPGLAQQSFQALTSPKQFLSRILQTTMKERGAAKRAAMDSATADYVAELLLSKDPALYTRGLAVAASTPGMLDSMGAWLRRMNENKALRAGTQAAVVDTINPRESQPGVPAAAQGLSQPGIWQQ